MQTVAATTYTINVFKSKAQIVVQYKKVFGDGSVRTVLKFATTLSVLGNARVKAMMAAQPKDYFEIVEHD